GRPVETESAPVRDFLRLRSGPAGGGIYGHLPVVTAGMVGLSGSVNKISIGKPGEVEAETRVGKNGYRLSAGERDAFQNRVVVFSLRQANVSEPLAVRRPLRIAQPSLSGYLDNFPGITPIPVHHPDFFSAGNSQNRGICDQGTVGRN